MANISVNSQVVIPNGPKMGFIRDMAVEAFDKIDVTVPPGETDMGVELQPAAAGKVQFLLIVSDWYGDDLSYKVNNIGDPPRTLDEPHIFTGKGAVSFLHTAPIAELFFGNATGDPANVQILVGREATP